MMTRRVGEISLIALMALCLGAGATMASAQRSPFQGTAGMGVSESSWGHRAGWNLIASPDGTVPAGAIGPLYSFNTVSGDYDSVAQGNAIVPGTGYWAYFDLDSRAIFGPIASSHVPITVPFPPSQWVLVGNPYSRVANRDGPDLIYHGRYIHPGEAVWMYSAAGGTGTFTNFSRCSG